MADYPTILSEPLVQIVLLFVLIFTVIFAILQKTKILGDGKKQIDALVALAIGLLVTSVGYATQIISQLIPFLAVSVIIILVFLILLGMFWVKDFSIHKGIQIAGGIVVFLAVVIAVLTITDSWQRLLDFFSGHSTLVTNIVLLVVVGLAVWAAIGFGGGSDGGKKN